MEHVCFVPNLLFLCFPHDRKNKASSEKYLKCISNLDFVVDSDCVYVIRRNG